MTTKREKIASRIADGVLASIELYYNHNTQNCVLLHVVRKLQQAEFKPKKATPEYKEARYPKNSEV